MIETGRSCVELAQQLHAIEKAVAAANKTLIHDHIHHCLAQAAEDAPQGAGKAVAELKILTKYLWGRAPSPRSLICWSRAPPTPGSLSLQSSYWARCIAWSRATPRP